MPTYRICTVGSDGSLIAGEDIECADDQEAIEKASQAAKDSGVELWQRDRCVVQLLPAPSAELEFSLRSLRRTVASTRVVLSEVIQFRNKMSVPSLSFMRGASRDCAHDRSPPSIKL